MPSKYNIRPRTILREPSIRYKLCPTGISDHLQFVNCGLLGNGREQKTNGSVEMTLASDALGSEPGMVMTVFAEAYLSSRFGS